MPKVTSLAERVWYAWHCLPRQRNGRLPSRRSLELRHKLPQASISKIVMGQRKHLREETAVRLAEALATTPEWLQYGRGPAPVAKYFVPPLPTTLVEADEAERKPLEVVPLPGLGDPPQTGAESSTRGTVPSSLRQSRHAKAWARNVCAGDNPTWIQAEVEARRIARNLPGWTFVAARFFAAPAHPHPIFPEYVIDLAKLVHRTASIASQVAAQHIEASEEWRRLTSWHEDSQRMEDAWREVYAAAYGSGEFSLDEPQLPGDHPSSIPPDEE